ncbi:sensor histidine kinase [Maribacter algicola]|uniref:Sensor histidine kinase n=1 Tax=Meishania litoralis TaxID=3434685 RepID=A0ACC7LI91_9FLAO
MGEGEVQSFLIIFSVIAICLALTVVVLFILFLRRKNALLLEQAMAKETYERELSETQIEIREETLRNISWELHDNIGQLMTLAKIQVQMVPDKSKSLEEASDTIGKAIRELRVLSKLINPEALKNLSLEEALELEIERFNRLQFVDASLTVDGTPKPLNPKEEVIIFRILQEFFSNTIKHSKASTLCVGIDYMDGNLTITADDDGIGFDENLDFSGIGIKNMKNRARLINADLQIESEKGRGTMLRLLYNFNHKPNQLA